MLELLPVSMTKPWAPGEAGARFPRGSELPHWNCSSSEKPLGYLWHTWALLGSWGSAPAWSPLGASEAVAGGGEALVPVLPAFPRQVLEQWASVLGSVSLYLGQSQAPASPFLAERELQGLCWESCCVAAEEPPMSLGRGLHGMGRSLHPALELL